MSDTDDSAEYGLVMPFVVCQSKDGPYEDTAFVAGYRLGLLDERLKQHRPDEAAGPFTPNDMPQVDLIAMRHGYRLHAVESEDSEWFTVRFTPAEGFT